MHKPITTIVFLLAALLLASPALAQNLLQNGELTEVQDGRPAGWTFKGNGSVAHATNPLPHVRLTASGGQDAMIEQRIAVDPAQSSRLRITVKYRFEGVEPGERGHQQVKVQARYTRDGRETGRWIDIGDGTGTSDWTQKVRNTSVPTDGSVNGIMLRFALYGVKAGRLDVASASITAVSAEQAAAERNAHRQMQPYGSKPSAERFARLSRGINIYNWFGQPYNAKGLPGGVKGAFTPEHFRSYITEHDLQPLRTIGFNNIRLPIEVAAFMDLESGDINPTLLGELDYAIGRMVQAGLDVQVDFHPKQRRVDSFGDRPEQAEHFVKWVGQMSAHLHKTTDPEWVFIELLNEPGGLQLFGGAWQTYQDRLINQACKNAPNHTLITNAGGYMLWHETIRHTPHPDRNVIFAVHYYEPSQSTHQGAVWMKDWYRITVDDYSTGRRYPDAIGHSFYFIDLHTDEGGTARHLDEGVVPSVPLSSLIPRGSRHLLVAGRCISSDRLANSALRVQSSCMAMGQGVGAAAALAVRLGIPSRDVPIDSLHRLLREHGAIIPD